jgi:hypothetical protein
MTRYLAFALAVALAGVAAAQPIGVVRPPQPDSFGLALAPLGNALLVGETRRARLVDPFTNTVLQMFGPPDNPSYFGTEVAGSGTNVFVAFGGAGHLFDATTGALVRTFTNPGAPGNGFGGVLAALGSDPLMGAPFTATGGAVYLLDGATGAVVRTFTAPVPAAGDEFGGSIAVLGGSVLIGAPGDDTATSNGGAAYLFDGATGALLQTFTNPAPVAEDRFGEAVALGADGALVGAPGEDFPAAAGRAYAFDSGTGALVASFSTPGTMRLGISVSWLGDDALVGAASPSAYVFDGSTGSLVRTLGNFLGDTSGFARVAAVDGPPVVGASGVSGLGADFYHGAVFLFCGGSSGCGPCETCGPAGTCVAEPHPTCHAPTSGRFKLRAVNSSRDASDLVGWSGRGNFAGVFLQGAQSGAGGNLSNPLAAGPDYTLCAYDESAPTPTLLFRATEPAAGACDGEPCWETGLPCTYYRCGFRYRDTEKTPEGVSRLGAKILSNDAPSTPFQFKVLARGENVSNRPGGLPPLPFPLPLRVQLQIRDGFCWEAEYSTAPTNSSSRFRATSD